MLVGLVITIILVIGRITAETRPTLGNSVWPHTTLRNSWQQEQFFQRAFIAREVEGMLEATLGNSGQLLATLCNSW